MTDLTPNHPAVEAATPDIHSISLREYTPEDCHETIADALNAALPHLTADDLRNTPAGKQLMAEAWDQGAADNERGWQHVYAGHDIDPDDPLAICQTCGTPNPYREGDA